MHSLWHVLHTLFCDGLVSINLTPQPLHAVSCIGASHRCLHSTPRQTPYCYIACTEAPPVRRHSVPCVRLKPPGTAAVPTARQLSCSSHWLTGQRRLLPASWPCIYSIHVQQYRFGWVPSPQSGPRTSLEGPHATAVVTCNIPPIQWTSPLWWHVPPR